MILDARWLRALAVVFCLDGLEGFGYFIVLSMWGLWLMPKISMSAN